MVNLHTLLASVELFTMSRVAPQTIEQIEHPLAIGEHRIFLA